MSISWEKLLEYAINILEESNIAISDWVFGGGTALMYYYQHRKSKDIDIFLYNIQFLTMVSPRLNTIASKIADDYQEAYNYVKINVKDQEIDFICAPSLTNLEPKLININNYDLYIEAPEEIVAKKLYYRPESLKLRDIIDIITVWQNSKDLIALLKEKHLIPAKELLVNKMQVLKESLANSTSTDYQKAIMELQLNNTIDFEFYLNSFYDFIGNLYNDDDPLENQPLL